jgi:hypothetical protein
MHFLYDVNIPLEASEFEVLGELFTQGQAISKDDKPSS